MNAEMLLKHFDRISEAPDAIPRLRRFILDLAVRGKLVEQDPNDEPAAELLKRIQAEKVRSVKKGQQKKEKPLAKLEASLMPYPLPESWHWSQLAEVGIISPRNTAADQEPASFVTMSMISAEYGISNRHDGKSWGEIKCGYTHFSEGDVGLAKITPCFENGKSSVFRDLYGGIGAGTTELHVVRPILIDADYILIFLKSPHFIDSGIPKMTGTAGQKRLPTEYFAYSPFPLPPLMEQGRIVRKVNELMGLCDQLEAARNERELRRDRLVASSLHLIGRAATNDEAEPAPAMADAIRFHLDYLPCLTTRLGHIIQLRRTILKLAVSGRLLPQHNEHQVAFALLKGIGAEPIKDAPFVIPASWEWASVGELADARLGKMLDKAKNKGIPRPYLRNINVRWFDFDLTDVYEMPFEDRELDEFALRVGDVLICEGGEPGRAAVWDKAQEEIYFQKAIHRVRFREGVDPYFFVYALRESAESGRLSNYLTGVGIKHFTGKGLTSYIFPLPPLDEQLRIVAKIRELMTLCDQLEARLTSTESDTRRLLEAALRDALAPASDECTAGEGLVAI